MTLLEIAIVLAIFFVYFNTAPILVYVERKICARIQDRIGPNRVGPFGILQPLADALKLLTKEEVIPARAERWLYLLEPVLSFLPAALAFAVIPVGNSVALEGGALLKLQISDMDVGILFVLAITSLGVYGIAFGGWTANSKYPLLGGLRSSAQLISYEVAMGLAIVSVLMTSGSVRMSEIVASQQGLILGFLPAWNVFQQPVAFVVFLVAMFAENNRLPFDLPEAESELVAGYHTEYSGMKFGLFFMGEYLAMTTMSAVLVTLFLGGWGFPGIDPARQTVGMAILTTLIFWTKVAAVLFFYIWVRWTLPRFRYDQLMRLGWKGMIPIGLANVLVTGVVGVIAS